MHNKHIREMRQGDAAALCVDLENTWRATFGLRMNAVLHTWTQPTGVGPLNACGITLCGKTLLPTARGDWENTVTERRCPACAQKMALLKEIADLLDKHSEIGYDGCS